MKILGIIASLCLIIATASLTGAEPADSQIKGAILDLERYEGQFLGKTSANASSVKRSLKLLTLTRQRLDSSPNKSHPSWAEADQRYKTLVAHMNNLVNGNAGASAPASAAPAPRPQAQASRTANASASNQPMISQYRVRIKKIQRDIASVFDTMDKGGVKPFQDPAYVRKFETSAQRFRESLTTYDPWKTDPDVVRAEEELQKLVNMINFGKDHAAKELAELGDVQGKLTNIESQFRELKQPPTPQEPFAPGSLSQWLTGLATTRQAAAKLYEPLPVIKERAYLPNNTGVVQSGAAYDFNDVVRLENGILGLVNNIDSELKKFGENLTYMINHVREQVQYFTQFDPADEQDQVRHFLSEGRADEVRAQINRDLQNVAEAAHYAKLLNDPSYGERARLHTEIQGILQNYEAQYQKARELIRMPEAASTDSELTKIAKECLAQYDYIGHIERMVINAPKRHLSKETSEEKFDDVDVSLSGNVTLTGTKTTWFYEWDEFQVATAEPVGDKYYIFYNTLKYFTSGASTTPLNRWVLSARIQGPEIPKENINKK